MSNAEATFLSKAIEIGLAQKVAALSAEVAGCIAQMSEAADQRYLYRLEEQQNSLRNPSLRTVAAMARAICMDEPSKAHVIAPAFAALAARHPNLQTYNQDVQALLDADTLNSLGVKARSALA